MSSVRSVSRGPTIPSLGARIILETVAPTDCIMSFPAVSLLLPRSRRNRSLSKRQTSKSVPSVGCMPRTLPALPVNVSTSIRNEQKVRGQTDDGPGQEAWHCGMCPLRIPTQQSLVRRAITTLGRKPRQCLRTCTLPRLPGSVHDGHTRCKTQAPVQALSSHSPASERQTHEVPPLSR